MNYYSQWDKADLDSWQGKEIDRVQDDDEDIEILNLEPIQNIPLFTQNDLMDEYGLTWSMFL